jgi:hypothetical protein
LKKSLYLQSIMHINETMNRKEYQKPQAEVFMTNLQTTLLAGSKTSLPADPGQGTGGALSPQYVDEIEEDENSNHAIETNKLLTF